MIPTIYKLKRATVTIKNCTAKSLYEIPYGKRMDMIKQLKLSMAKYELGSEDWNYLRKEIQLYRGNGVNQNKSVSKKATSKPNRVRFEFTVQLNDWCKSNKVFTYDLWPSDILTGELRNRVRFCVKETIQLVRLARKFAPHMELNLTTDTLLEMSSKKKGRVFMKGDQILKLHIKKNLKALYEDKKPTTANNYLGVEIEFCAPMTEEKMAIELFKAGFQSYVQLKKDGSLRPHDSETGFEFAMLLKEGSYKKDLKKVTDFISKVKGLAVDRRCGFHVHFDMRKRDKDIVFNNLVSCQNVLLSLVDPRRYDNEFCRIVNSKKFPINFKNTREERYKTINAAAYYRHKTLEVRMHEGTVDYTDMCNWIDVCLKIVNYKKKMKSNISKLPLLKKRVKLPEKTYKASLDKSCFWQINQADHVARAVRLQEELLRDARRALNLEDDGPPEENQRTIPIAQPVNGLAN